jgi:hypothetical protein
MDGRTDAEALLSLFYTDEIPTCDEGAELVKGYLASCGNAVRWACIAQTATLRAEFNIRFSRYVAHCETCEICNQNVRKVSRPRISLEEQHPSTIEVFLPFPSTALITVQLRPFANMEFFFLNGTVAGWMDVERIRHRNNFFNLSWNDIPIEDLHLSFAQDNSRDQSSIYGRRCQRPKLSMRHICKRVGPDCGAWFQTASSRKISGAFSF